LRPFLTLLVVPALYALWFRVRREETAGASAAGTPAPVEQLRLPLPIAAE
jgi:hypothetical protein